MQDLERSSVFQTLLGLEAKLLVLLRLATGFLILAHGNGTKQYGLSRLFTEYDQQHWLRSFMGCVWVARGTSMSSIVSPWISEYAR